MGYSAQAYLLAGFLDKQQTQLKLICLLGFFLTHNKQQTTTPAQAYLLAGFLFNKQQTTNNKPSSSLFACWVSRLKQPPLLGYSAQAYLLAGFLDKQQTQLKLICLLGFFLTHNKQQTTTPAQAYLLAGFLFNKQQTTNNKPSSSLFACWVSF